MHPHGAGIHPGHPGGHPHQQIPPGHPGHPGGASSHPGGVPPGGQQVPPGHVAGHVAGHVPNNMHGHVPPGHVAGSSQPRGHGGGGGDYRDRGDLKPKKRDNIEKLLFNETIPESLDDIDLATFDLDLELQGILRWIQPDPRMLREVRHELGRYFKYFFLYLNFPKMCKKR